MRYLSVGDFVGALDTAGILKGKIIKVYSDTCTVDVDIEGFDVVLRSVPIRPVYCSNVCHSAVIIMPREGDLVWLGKCQGEFMILGYVAERDLVNVEGSEIDKTVLKRYKTEAEMESDLSATIYDLKPGDVGFFVHEGDRMLEFMMLQGGRIVMGFGIGTVIYNQDEVSERKLLNKYRSVDANGSVVEWGLPEVKVASGVTLTMFKEFVFKIVNKDGKEVLQFGYIDDGRTGMPELGRFGGDLRFRLKIGNYEVNMDSGGNSYITINNVRIEEENEDVVIRVNKTESVGGDFELKTGRMCKIKANGNIIIEGGNIEIKGANVTIRGIINLNEGVALLKETIIPLLENHSHEFYGDGTVGRPIGLQGLSAHKTLTVRAN